MSRKPRKLHVAFATWKFPAIANTFILNEIVEVLKRGHEVSIYSIDRSDDAVVHDDVARWDLLRRTSFLDDHVPRYLRRGGFDDYRADWLGDRVYSFRPLGRKLLRDGVDVVHGCFMNNSATVAMALARVAGLPFTFECHAHDLFVDLRYADEKIADADRIFSISDYNRRYLVDELGCRPEKIVIRRVPILKEFCDAIPATERQPGLVVFVGRLHAIKGLADAIRAFAIVARRMPEARFVIIGDGELRTSLEALASGLGVGDRVRFAGYMTNEDSLREVARASAFLLPSVIDERGDRDGIPTSMIEAMYLRTPTVSTRVSGIPELVEDGVSGMLAEPGDVDAIAAKLESVLKLPDLRERLGAAGRDVVEREFDCDRNIDVLVDNWRAVVDERPRRGLLSRTWRRLAPV